ncbi:MAG: hypothetical protein JSR37_09380 [Verrucomicrobia bacterium]|nr:hypothetical protein [Verrucomicrobiota bacterium]MBS0636583.1 hypothetical protein [Verrucomicrobiota bacterium]
MQLYALDSAGKKCSIYAAQKGNDYFCLECNSRLRARRGRFCRPHFYHIYDVASCRQSGKTEAHIAIQRLIGEQIGAHKTQEELRFDSIGRIADVAWPEKKLIFEVQCSPISAEEVEARNRDYASIGWNVIWVLHDKRFNKRRLSDAETFLLSHPHYFSDAKSIYDQLKSERERRSIIVSTVAPMAFSEKLPYLPPSLETRFYSWCYYMEGDYLYAALHEGYTFSRSKKSYVKRLKAAFRGLWHLILERSCS